MRGRRAAGIALRALALAGAAWAGALEPAAAAGGGVVEVPVRFAVENVNRTPAPCPVDGTRYELSGHLVAPAGTLTGPGPRAVTLHLHGVALGERSWRFPAVPGYDHGRALAEAGHAVVTIDQLGYGASPLPFGAQVCPGGQADIAHQVVQHLRAGTYAGAADAGGGFERVGLVGLSFGGLLGEIEAATFQDVDALVVAGWSNRGAAPELITEGFGEARCEPKHEGGPLGYTWNFRDPDERWMLTAADRAMREAFARTRERDPCGIFHAFVEITAAPLYVKRIEAPVLLVMGDRDPLFPPESGEQERALFGDRDDVTLRYVRGAGHFLPLEPQAPEFREILSDWLADHGL